MPDQFESNCAHSHKVIINNYYALISSLKCNVLLLFVAQIGMEHWLYDGFQVGEPYTFTFNTYNPILGVQVDDQSVLSQAGT